MAPSAHRPPNPLDPAPDPAPDPALDPAPDPALDPVQLAQADVEVRRPARLLSPAVFASPHSGRRYPPAFLDQARLDAKQLRKSEDAFVDDLFDTVPLHGAPLLLAHFPRAYLDVNREAYELDPDMFSDRLPDHAVTRSPRVAAGLGTVPRIVANGEDIYGGRLSYAAAKDRIERHHHPYHAALAALLADARHGFGAALLIDCHSMPSAGGAEMAGRGHRGVDIVLGDCHGSACAPEITAIAERALVGAGFNVIRNKPYAGGHTTRHYGRPMAGVHALQIEISRALYMNEARLTPKSGFADIKRRLGPLIEALSAIDTDILTPRAAAE